MTNTQLYLIIGIPILFNAAMFGLMKAYINAKFEKVDERFNTVNERFNRVDEKFNTVYERFNSVDKQFVAAEKLWKLELSRVEKVLDNFIKEVNS